MKRQTLWMLIFCCTPLVLLFLFQAFNLGEIVTDSFLLGALLIFLLVVPGDLETEGKAPGFVPLNKQHPISPKNTGLALGITLVLLHLGCVFIMFYLKREGTVTFFNNMFHGMDFSTVVKTNVTWTEIFAGAMEIFIAGTFIGICFGGIYNFLQRAR